MKDKTIGATIFFIIGNSEETFCKHLTKMGTQEVVNLLNSSENEYSKFATKNSMLLTVSQKVFIHIKIQSNQAFLIILMHMF